MRDELQVIDRFLKETTNDNLRQFVNHILNGKHDEVLPLSIWKECLSGKIDVGTNTLMFSFLLREVYVKRFSWFIVTSELVDVLAKQFEGKKVADLGCGSGYLSSLLNSKGIDVTGV